MINPEAIDGLRVYSLTPEYVSQGEESQGDQREGRRRSPGQVAAAAIERVRHHWG